MKSAIYLLAAITTIYAVGLSVAQDPAVMPADDAAVLRQREHLVRLVTRRASELSSDELSAAIDSVQLLIDNQRLRATDTKERQGQDALNAAIQQLTATVNSHKGTKAAVEAKLALHVLGYTIWRDDKVYHEDTVFIGDFPLNR